MSDWLSNFRSFCLNLQDVHVESLKKTLKLVVFATISVLVIGRTSPFEVYFSDVM